MNEELKPGPIELVPEMDDLLWIQNELNVPKKHRNDFGGFNYRNMEDILEALKPLLTDRGCRLLLHDEIVIVGESLPVTVGERETKDGKEDFILSAPRVYVKTTARFTDSKMNVSEAPGYAREPVDKKGMDDSQLTGSTASYAGKRALGNLFLLDDNRDADDLPATTEDEIAWFLDLIANEESAKLYYFNIHEADKFSALLRSAAPKGKLTVFKRDTKALSFKGYKQAEEQARELIKLAGKKDVMGIRQITDEMIREEKELAWMQIPKAVQHQINKLLKEES